MLVTLRHGITLLRQQLTATYAEYLMNLIALGNLVICFYVLLGRASLLPSGVRDHCSFYSQLHKAVQCSLCHINTFTDFIVLSHSEHLNRC